MGKGWKGPAQLACSLWLFWTLASELGSRGQLYQTLPMVPFLKPGWLPFFMDIFSFKGRHVDAGDTGWIWWRYNIFHAFLWAVFHSGISFLVDFLCSKRFSSQGMHRARLRTNLFLSFLLIWKLYGVYCWVQLTGPLFTYIVVVVAQLLSKIAGEGKRGKFIRWVALILIWAVKLSVMLKAEDIKEWILRKKIFVLRSFAFQVSKLIRPGRLQFSGIFKFELYRSVDFATHVLLAEKQEWPSFWRFMEYSLYAPLVWQGPIMSYRAFVHECETRYGKSKGNGRIHVKRFNLPLLKEQFGILVVCFLMLELLEHNFFVGMYFKRNVVSRMHSGELYAAAVLKFVLSYLKIRTSWTFFRMWAIMDRVTPPENFPKSLWKISSVNDFWRSFNASIHLWVLANIFTPLSRLFKHSRTLSVIATFAFMAVWHGLDTSWVYFGILNATLIIWEQWAVDHPRVVMRLQGILFAFKPPSRFQVRLLASWVWTVKAHLLLFFWINMSSPKSYQWRLDLPLRMLERVFWNDQLSEESAKFWNIDIDKWNSERLHLFGLLSNPTYTFVVAILIWTLFWFGVDNMYGLDRAQAEQLLASRDSSAKSRTARISPPLTQEEHERRRQDATSIVRETLQHAKTICDVLKMRASSRLDRDRVALVWLDNAGNQVQTLTFGELYEKSISLSHVIRGQLKAKPGDRVVLVYPPGLAFVVAMFACMFARTIAVPVYPPGPQGVAKDQVFQRVVQDCKPAAILTDSSYSTFLTLQTASSFMQNRSHLAALSLCSLPFLLTSWMLWGSTRVSPAMSFFLWLCSLGVSLAFTRWVIRAIPVAPSPSSKRPWYRTDSFVEFMFPSLVQAWKLTTRQLRERMGKKTGQVKKDEGEEMDMLESGAGIHPSDVAYLQYTSGSTADPKGVRITHANIMHQGMINQIAFGCLGRGETAVNWCPQYHDLGLVVCILSGVFAGIRLVAFSPMDFLRNPLLWLDAISTYRAAFSAAPNFAYGYVVRKAKLSAASPDNAESKVIQDLDLSCWRVAGNGGEPVRAETLARFQAEFANKGFSPEAFFPCFGLAEHTIMASGRQKCRVPTILRLDSASLAQNMVVQAANDTATDAITTLVGCGEPLEGVLIEIVDAFTHERLTGTNTVGEIWLAGASVADGYWGRTLEENDEEFRAKIADDMHLSTSSSSQTYLRTGDLGFLFNGELFICGRMKDLIIIDGKNHYPQDVESCAERAAPKVFRPSCCAAYLGSDGVSLVLVAEVRRELISDPDFSRLVRAACVSAFDAVLQEEKLSLTRIIVVGAGVLPKTSSGKIKRKKIKALQEEGGLEKESLLDLSSQDLASLSSSGIDEFGTEDEVIDESNLYDSEFLQIVFAIFKSRLGGPLTSVEDPDSWESLLGRSEVLDQPLAPLLTAQGEGGMVSSLEAVQFANALQRSLDAQGVSSNVPPDVALRFHTVGRLARFLHS